MLKPTTARSRSSIPHREVIYTGPIDEYFDYRFGRLPYGRSSSGSKPRHERHQPVAVDQLSQRKPLHADHRVQAPHRPGASEDHARLRIPEGGGRPYYPIPRPENAELYRHIRRSPTPPGVHFVGRLGTYRYYNMDQVVAQALTLYAKLTGQSRREALANPA